jgi:SWIM/SEC-C metal-binding protein
MAKLGSKGKPAIVHVQTMERAQEIMELCNKNDWQVIVGIEPDKTEDISDIKRLLNPPNPIIIPVSTARNAPCPCGSGKKYKNCCVNIKSNKDGVDTTNKN